MKNSDTRPLEEGDRSPSSVGPDLARKVGESFVVSLVTLGVTVVHLVRLVLLLCFRDFSFYNWVSGVVIRFGTCLLDLSH